ncbi:hypothetical protein ES332_A10G023600v1 [Gossypium tomentosum]|uniref:Uncharacterized protein n=1 Tax=Gossypium tomentosum TaxID=34277 RepID=A0A5D2NND3_GOSTO|nr:hypothetical protein ES332_A10G023600v1 [Gossypium tomentosum]
MAKSVENRALKKGAWSPEEDKKLIAYIKRYGIWNWAEMAKPAGLQRSGKSCRLRWVNYLRPGIKHGNFTKEEEETIIDLHEKLGNRWSVIASKLPGRTDNEIKNHWHAHLSKRLKYDLNSLPDMSDAEIDQYSSFETDPPPTNVLNALISESSAATFTDSLPSSSSNPKP